MTPMTLAFFTTRTRPVFRHEPCDAVDPFVRIDGHERGRHDLREVTCAGSRACATTFASTSHSVTIPTGPLSGVVTTAKPWCRVAIAFAAWRTEVSGGRERKSVSTMSFA